MARVSRNSMSEFRVRASVSRLMIRADEHGLAVGTAINDYDAMNELR